MTSQMLLVIDLLNFLKWTLTVTIFRYFNTFEALFFDTSELFDLTYFSKSDVSHNAMSNKLCVDLRRNEQTQL